MSSWKYVIVESAGREWPVIFPEAMIHENFSVAVQSLLRFVHKQDPAEMKVVAAGTVHLKVQSTDGFSTTLNIGPREGGDVEALEMHSYGMSSDAMATILAKAKAMDPEGYKKAFGE